MQHLLRIHKTKLPCLLENIVWERHRAVVLGGLAFVGVVGWRRGGSGRDDKIGDVEGGVVGWRVPAG